MNVRMIVVEQSKPCLSASSNLTLLCAWGQLQSADVQEWEVDKNSCFIKLAQVMPWPSLEESAKSDAASPRHTAKGVAGSGCQSTSTQQQLLLTLSNKAWRDLEATTNRTSSRAGGRSSPITSAMVDWWTVGTVLAVLPAWLMLSSTSSPPCRRPLHGPIAMSISRPRAKNVGRMHAVVLGNH